jgi:hypothetical protein
MELCLALSRFRSDVSSTPRAQKSMVLQQDFVFPKLTGFLRLPCTLMASVAFGSAGLFSSLSSCGALQHCIHELFALSITDLLANRFDRRFLDFLSLSKVRNASQSGASVV